MNSKSDRTTIETSFDVVVIGGGHAGIEAAMASSRLGCRTALMTMDAETIGQMSCNPAIGGTAKGHVVREIDALGGVMAKLIDAAGIQFRMLNRSKGPAMWSPRAQADRTRYRQVAREYVEHQSGLSIVEDTVAELIVEDDTLIGVRGASGVEYRCTAAVVSSGTFLRGLMHTGTESTEGGRIGEPASQGLSDCLRGVGLRLGRMKTGTPPRVDGETIDFDAMSEQLGDDPPPRFSYTPSEPELPQVSCWLTRTNATTHELLRAGFDESPLYTGRIQGIGPRYCPSIEDKISRFTERESHRLLIEPEGIDTTEVYINGFSTSLPEDIQRDALRTVQGMEHVEIIRYGYAVEYDFVYPQQLRSTLEAKSINGLYFAGQVCGTSGYEEAAGQGLMAGINAARSIQGMPSVVLRRDEAYIGVMIDDLVTRGVDEPYRLFTSRAEHRLLLRQDNADVRLANSAFAAGMISETELQVRQGKERRVQSLVDRINAARVNPRQANDVLVSLSSPRITQTVDVPRLLKRPEVALRDIERMNGPIDPDAVESELVQAEFIVKYEGYLKRQEAAAARQVSMDRRMLPTEFDYASIPALRTEAKERLSEVRPKTIGQASRIPGITPADIAVVAIVNEQRRRSRRKRATVDI
jgi:tRNA uridine 5-carboxymethylaminomethyl modification enzyme